MVFLARRSPRIREPGFTLLELLLTVTLLLALLSAVIFNFTTLKTGATLEEGSRQFEALIHFAAANAANSGRVVQFRFDNVSTNETSDFILPLRIVREVDPVGQPGVFEDLPEAAPLLAEVLERIRVSSVKSGERPPNQGTNEFAFEESSSTPPISFYPDGSADTVDIILASRDPDDFREMTIHARFVRS
jgi:prepilin-type N-terminal cleavage/methylation domain-containing protein